MAEMNMPSMATSEQIKSINDWINFFQFTHVVITASSLTGNSDQAINISLPSGWSADDVVACFFLGYVPNTTWGTRIIPSNISRENNVWKFYFHIDGSTSQNYSLRFFVIRK